jgi:hypothetical protein
MKRTNFYFCVFAVIGVFMFSSCEKKVDLASKLYAELDLTAAPNTLTEKESKAEWKLLFDGETTEGWHGYNMLGIPDVWTVEDGCITVNGEGGGEEQDIITNDIYGSFAFTLEYKLSQGSNSGVLFQVKEDAKYTFAYETGPEIQLIDDIGRYGNLSDVQGHGANYAMYPPKAKPFNPTGEWNRLFLVVNGNKVTHFVNGVELVSYEKYSDEWVTLRNSGKWEAYPDYGVVDEGHISLQNHGSKLWFRNIKIKQL